MIKQVLSNIVHEVNKKIPDINNGGCGVFSYMLAKKLESCGYDYEFLLNNVDEHNDHTISCSHVWLGVYIKENQYEEFNCDNFEAEIYRNKDYFKYTLKKSLDKKHKYQWNSDYDRKQNKLLNEIINKHFSALK